MKLFVAKILVCPKCLPKEVSLICREEQSEGDDVWKGYLQCPSCSTRFPITEGIADLTIAGGIDGLRSQSKYETEEVVSSYLWSHYADLFSDPEATDAYNRWAALIKTGLGFALDAGCAVGRFAFELARKKSSVVGFDISRSFIRKARELLVNRGIEFSLKEEGLITRRQTIELPSTWNTDNLEFIVADARLLPFAGGAFSSISSLNIVDKLPKPLEHLAEMNRVASQFQSEFLVSDPFSWSSEVADAKDWLGGVGEGRNAGRGLDNLEYILKQTFNPPWYVEERGSVWWKIRNHANHYELIRSCFIKAVR